MYRQLRTVLPDADGLNVRPDVAGLEVTGKLLPIQWVGSKVLPDGCSWF